MVLLPAVLEGPVDEVLVPVGRTDEEGMAPLEVGREA